jgi:hypothetical protein
VSYVAVGTQRMTTVIEYIQERDNEIRPNGSCEVLVKYLRVAECSSGAVSTGHAPPRSAAALGPAKTPCFPPGWSASTCSPSLARTSAPRLKMPELDSVVALCESEPTRTSRSSCAPSATTRRTRARCRCSRRTTRSSSHPRPPRACSRASPRPSSRPRAATRCPLAAEEEAGAAPVCLGCSSCSLRG